MAEVELGAGPIEYEDTGGTGPVVVLLHGLAMTGSVWRHVVADLRADHRCVVPTVPLGGHRRPMNPDADLSLSGMVGLVADFLDRLGLREVTLVGNDWGGAQLLVTQRRDERVGRLVLAACEAFDNYPPGIPGRLAALSAKTSVATYVMAQSMRLRPLRRAPMSWGWMSKRPVPHEVMDEWFRPLATSWAIRRDFRAYAGSVPDKATLLEWAERQRAFDRPVLVVWATEDRLMPRAHGQRLVEHFPDARLVEIADSYTLIPEDQPRQLSGAIRRFVNDTS
ncbi:MAG TPA: alpha/beta hydrolase [Jiangellaceae bacterium]|nr:alpha/beta hydrolase [Jiangellaceae bacterium]